MQQKEIDKCEELPKKESISINFPWWNRNYHDYRISGIKISPWDLSQRMCKKYLGKTFDQAFSHYCSIVPVVDQKYFLELFNKNHWRQEFELDNGIIKRTTPNKRKKTYKIYSPDYKREKIYYDKFGKECDHYSARYVSGKYKVTQGYVLEFDSKNDPEYKRLRKEELRAIKRVNKEKRKQLKDKVYSFLTKEEQELKLK